MARKTDKREKLLFAADQLFLVKGVHETTLADMASLAEVPLGNVYYYFKTKAELISGVIKVRAKALTDILANIEAEYETPELQLKAFIAQFLNAAELEGQNFGLMVTALNHELSKTRDHLFTEFLAISERIIAWCKTRFEAIGGSEQAHEYALGLLAMMQGTCVMQHDPALKQFMPLQAKFIEQAIWIAE